MGCKNHIKYYWDCNVDHHREFYSFSKEERNVWTDFLIKRLNNSRKVLELGCGTGNVTEALVEGGCDVTALDISYEMIKEVGERNDKSKVLVGDAETLSFRDNSFDAVVCRNLLCTLPNPENALKEFFRVLKDHGRLCVIDKTINDRKSIKKVMSQSMMLIKEKVSGNENKLNSVLIPYHKGFKPGCLASIVCNLGFNGVETDELKHVNTARKSLIPKNAVQDENFCVTAEKHL